MYIYTPYMTVYLVISLPKIPYVNRIYMVLANLSYMASVYTGLTNRSSSTLSCSCQQRGGACQHKLASVALEFRQCLPLVYYVFLVCLLYALSWSAFCALSCSRQQRGGACQRKLASVALESRQCLPLVYYVFLVCLLYTLS